MFEVTKACGVFMKLLEEQLDRVAGMNEEKTDFSTTKQITIGVIDGVALPPVEIIPKSGFYDYSNKYQSGRTEEICPAPLTEDENKRLADAALKAFDTLRLGSYARIDFIYDGKDFYCLEANTLPGMTPLSLLPQESKAVGIEYGDLCEKLVMLEVRE